MQVHIGFLKLLPICKILRFPKLGITTIYDNDVRRFVVLEPDGGKSSKVIEALRFRHLAIAALHVSCRRSTGAAYRSQCFSIKCDTVRTFHMPDEQDSEKTPFSGIWELGDRIVLTIRRWLRLKRNERFDVVLIVIGGIAGLCAFGSATAWFLSTAIYRSPWFFGGAATVAVCSLAIVLWRDRNLEVDHHRKLFVHPLLHLIIVIVIAIGCVSAVGLYRYRRTSRFHGLLKNSGLPPELYNDRLQLSSLAIDQNTVTDLDWLDAATITELKIASNRLGSLRGLKQVPNLQSLELDLKGAPLESLVDVLSLRQLQTLTLHNVGRAKTLLAAQLQVLPQLTKLNLDFERSTIASLPDLSACHHLNDLTLNLRSTAIRQLPEFSGFQELHSVSLFLDNSRVRNLRPLAALDLHELVLSLDGTQVEMLLDLNSNSGPHSLDIALTSPPNDGFPDLRGISNLEILTLRMPGARGINLPDRTPVPDITYLGNKLHGLTLSVKGSEIRQLPDVGRLSDLLNLGLDLEASRVQAIPDLSRLHDLQELTINICSTEISELPDFAQFPKLRELTLFLCNSQIHSLHGIQNLKKLRTMTLDLRGAKLDDIDAIAQIGTLEKLVLRLRWSQVASLPDLGELTKLRTVELHIENWWPHEELPDISKLPNLTDVRLTLVGSDIKDLSRLVKLSKMENLDLDLRDSTVVSLPDLRTLDKLSSVSADVRHSKIILSELAKFGTLKELTIDKSVLSLEHLPKTVNKLVIGPCSEMDKQCKD